MTSSSPTPGSLLALCYGSRPQVIKASLLLDALSERWRVLTVDTGQHYDYELNAGLYDALGVRRPDHFLGVGSASHAEQTSATITRAAEVFERERPALVVVIGDTNSTLGCALAAAKMRIPVVHVEAGLRAADVLMAEDINRRLVDELAGLLCTPSSLATAELHARRVPGTIVQTGDVAYDVLLRNAGRADAVKETEGWPADPDAPYIFATLHRAELTGNDGRMRGVLAGLSALEMPVVFAVHPRTRPVLEKESVRGAIGENVHLLPPLGYLDAVAAVRDALAVVTDSGGIQREAYWLGTPCITVRDETEWCETLELGANILLPPAQAREELPGLVRARAASRRAGWRRTAYGSGDAARKVAEAVAEWVNGSHDARKQQVS
jgi:UDP-N-acetylglucosamine 2-epimerase